MFWFWFLVALCCCENLPQVSVIMPVYNMGSSVSRALESVLNQTLKNIEIICIDDGSTDNSPTVLDHFADIDKRVAVVHLEKNGGISSAQNIGISKAEGEYVAFVHADDWIEFDALESAYVNAKEASVDVVEFGHSDFFSDGSYHKNRDFLPLPRSEGPKNVILRGAEAAQHFVPGWKNTPYIFARMYSKSFLKTNNILLNSTLRWGEDVTFLFNLVPHIDSLLLINRILYRKLSNPFTLGMTQTAKDMENFRDAIVEVMNRIRNCVDCKYCIVEKDVESIQDYLEKLKDWTETKRNFEEKKRMEQEARRLKKMIQKTRNLTNFSKSCL